MEKYYSINKENCSIRCKVYADDLNAVTRVIVFCHGFGGDKNSRSAERFARRALMKNKGLAVVCFDWPCHGEDARKRLELDECRQYLRLVTADVRERFQPEDLCAYATSFGGFLLLDAIADAPGPFRKIALRCPAVNIYESLTGAFIHEEEQARLDRGRPVSVGFERKMEITRGFLEDLRRADVRKKDYLPYADDILILQGTKDELVPFEAVKAFAEDNLLDFVPVTGADHMFKNPQTMDLAIAQILAYFGLR